MPKDLNIILVSLDAARPDHFGCYGYSRPTSPNLDKLAQEGVLFEQAIAATYWTLPSHASMLSGLTPLHHGATDPAETINAKIPLLPALLKEKGYATAGFISGPFLSTVYGFDRGFDIYKTLEKPGGRQPQGLPCAENIVSAVIGWLKQNKQQKFFVFAHFFDTHEPYSPPAPFNDLFDKDYTGSMDGHLPFSKRVVMRTVGVSQKDLTHLIALYDGSIAYVDSQLGRLFSFLKEEGLFDNTLIIVTADHGDQFGEHGKFGHGNFYDTELKVPLIMHCPKLLPKGERRKQLVRHIDLAPTIWDLLELDAALAANGVSLLPVINKNADLNLKTICDGGLKDNNFCIRTNRWKYFETSERAELMKGASKFQKETVKKKLAKMLYQAFVFWKQGFKFKEKCLFDLQADPLEQHNLFKERPDMVKQFRHEIKEYQAKAEKESPINKQITSDEAKQLEDRLQALGYID